MRDVLKRSLGRSLEGLSAEDRLAAAWTVACGPALAGRGEITGFAEGVLEVGVADTLWLQQFQTMQAMLAREISRISGVEVTAIHWIAKGFTR